MQGRTEKTRHVQNYETSKDAMTLQDYRNKTRKTITLPSGLEVSVRPLSISDLVELGTVPDGFLEGNSAAAMVAAKANPKILADIMKAILLNCVSHVQKEGEAQIRICDKAPQDCGANEISWRDVTQADAIACMNAHNAIPTKEVAAGAAKFPEQAKS